MSTSKHEANHTAGVDAVKQTGSHPCGRSDYHAAALSTLAERFRPLVIVITGIPELAPHSTAPAVSYDVQSVPADLEEFDSII